MRPGWAHPQPISPPAIRMSQTDLGDALGLTFQQVRYEKGTNRVGASRLHSTSRISCRCPWHSSLRARRISRGSDAPSGRLVVQAKANLCCSIHVSISLTWLRSQRPG
jgi:hypothetical protein